MQHVLRVTYAQMEGSQTNQLAIPDLQSMPSARAITVRNLKPPGRLTMSGQPTVKRSAAARVKGQATSQLIAKLTTQLREGLAAIARDRRRVWLNPDGGCGVRAGRLRLAELASGGGVARDPCGGVRPHCGPRQVLRLTGSPTLASGSFANRAEPALAKTAVTPEPIEPKAVRVDDLPREPSRGTRRH